MKSIRNIAKLFSNYIRHDMPHQANIEDIPFQIRAGILTSDGRIQNAPPPSRFIRNEDISLGAATNSQLVAMVRNRSYKRLMLILQQTVTKVSFDFTLRFSFDSLLVKPTHLGNETTPHTRWADDTLGTDSLYSFDGLVPCGENLRIQLYIDNNHATDPIVLRSAFLFYDPIM